MRVDKDEKIARLEAVIKQMLQPLKGVPLDLIVSTFTGAKVIPFAIDNRDDIQLAHDLRDVVRQVFAEVNANPIVRRRANEVGNAIEPFVSRAILSVGLRCVAPAGKTGRQRAAGYPDLLIFDRRGRPSYIECKTFNAENVNTTLRAFYLSPSSDFKASVDARHLLLAFEMVRVDGRQDAYVAVGAKLLSLENLVCDVKYEFNASNRDLYSRSALVFEERLAR